MSRGIGRVKTSFVAAVTLLALSGQSPKPSEAPTPPATTSGDCATPTTDTQRFLAAAGFSVKTPHGRVFLVPVTQEATRERGLMCVVRIPPGRGMIFVFAPPDRVQGFWMKNTLVALDMVFVTTAGIVSTVASNIPATPNGTPDSDVARRQGIGQFVIELGAGDAARHGIVRGTKLTLPALTAQQ